MPQETLRPHRHAANSSNSAFQPWAALNRNAALFLGSLWACCIEPRESQRKRAIAKQRNLINPESFDQPGSHQSGFNTLIHSTLLAPVTENPASQGAGRYGGGWELPPGA